MITYFVVTMLQEIQSHLTDNRGVVGKTLKLHRAVYRESFVIVAYSALRNFHTVVIGHIAAPKMSEQNTVKIMEAMKKTTKVVRPPGPPKIWEVVEKKGKNGQPIKFTIQEIPKDRNEDAVEHMCKYFLTSEPTCMCFNAANTPLFVKEVKALWRGALEQGISIVAFVDNPDGGKPIIAGLNILCMEYKEEDENAKDIHFDSQFQSTFEIMMKLSKELQLYERYGVDKYIYAIGLCVMPAFRGCGLGADLLKVRDKIGRAYNIAMTSTAFTSPYSVKAAERAGFELLLSKNYSELVDENGKENFPGIQKYSKCLTMMAKKLR